MIVLYLNGQIDLNGCSVNYSFTFFVLHDTFVYMLPIFIAICLNLINIYKIFKRSKESKKMNAIANKQTNQTADISKSADIPSLKVIVYRQTRRKCRQELKSVICILAMVLNMLINEYTFLIVWTVLVKCFECISLDFFYITLIMVYFFPVINPVLLFIFNRRFQNQTKKIFKRKL